MELFPPPIEPHNVFEWVHDHVWVEVGARLNPSGTWSSIWRCDVCTDIGVGGYVGPIPPGYCRACGWTQKKWPRKRCEECKARFADQADYG